MSDLPRTQHILASGLVAVIGVSVAIISFTQETPPPVPGYN